MPGDGTITAHVMIRYAGAPESFAWIVPVPSAPTLALSESSAFGAIDSRTRPNDPPAPASLCPGENAVSCVSRLAGRQT